MGRNDEPTIWEVLGALAIAVLLVGGVAGGLASCGTRQEAEAGTPLPLATIEAPYLSGGLVTVGSIGRVVDCDAGVVLYYNGGGESGAGVAALPLADTRLDTRGLCPGEE
jgi:hypothetical protein